MTTSTETFTYDDAKDELRLDDFAGDPWGTTMAWWFAVSDEIYFHRDDIDVPHEWQFSPSPFGPAEDDEYRTEVVKGMPDADLVQFGNLLCRLDEICRERGWNY